MPPQQSGGLLDRIDEGLMLGAHASPVLGCSRRHGREGRPPLYRERGGL
jgi:hypothetical protein